jgi:hypothetical protein
MGLSNRRTLGQVVDKNRKSEQKAMDAIKPKTGAGPASQSIVPNRPILGRTPAGVSAVHHDPTEPAAALSAHKKSIVINPLMDEREPATDSSAKNDSPAADPTPNDKNKDDKPPVTQTPVPDANNGTKPDETKLEETKPEADKIETDLGTDTDEKNEDINGTDAGKPDQPSLETRKALEEVKHEEKLEGYIQSKQFFVPINTEEQKRSIKVSFGLTLLLFMLGVLLINFMLDSGIIFLIQKIPHTDFFPP